MGNLPAETLLVDCVNRIEDRRLRAAAWRHVRRINPKVHMIWAAVRLRQRLEWEGIEIGAGQASQTTPLSINTHAA